MPTSCTDVAKFLLLVLGRAGKVPLILMDEGVLLLSMTKHLAWKLLLLERARAGKVPLMLMEAFSYRSC